MTERFEQQLAERLQAHPLPNEVPDLGMRSARLGQRMRRRRIAAVAALLIMLIALPGFAISRWRAWMTDVPPVTTASTPPATVPGPKALILDPVGRLQGPAPEVASIREKSLWLPSGDTLKLPNDQFGTVAEFGDEFAWLTRTAGELRLNVAAQPLPITTNGKEVTGVEPGPNGSVMVRTKAGPILWTTAGTFVTPSEPLLDTDQMVATADALWVVAGGVVTRVDMADPTSRSNSARAYPRWKKLVIGDPRADRVVVTDPQGCQAVLNGSTAELVLGNCGSKVGAISPDGQFAVARRAKSGTIDVIDLASGRLRLSIDPENNPVGPVFVFDQANRLNLRVGNAEVRFGFMVVDTSGDCWVSTTYGYPDPIDFVLPNSR